MTLLIDTNVVLWWLMDSAVPPAHVYPMIEDPNNEVFVSSISYYEIALKHALGKLTLAGQPDDIPSSCETAGFLNLPIEKRHALWAGRLPLSHKEPWDRLLAAQAIIEGLTIVSNDRAFDALGAARSW